MKLFAKGFTLVEILIVIMLVGALIFFTLMYIPAQIAKARDAERKADIDMINNFIEEYYFDTGCYPVSIPDCKNPFALEDKTYIASIPCDPSIGYSYVYESEVSSCPRWFRVYGNLEYTKDRVIDEIGCRNGCGPKCQFNYGKASPNVDLNPFCKVSVEEKKPPKNKNNNNEQYVCAPGGSCEAFRYPEESGCPDIYLNDPTCGQNQWCSDAKYRCHDSRGKMN